MKFLPQKPLLFPGRPWAFGVDIEWQHKFRTAGLASLNFFEKVKRTGFTATIAWPFVRRIVLMSCTSSTESTKRIGMRERIRKPKSLLFIRLSELRAYPSEGMSLWCQ